MPAAFDYFAAKSALLSGGLMTISPKDISSTTRSPAVVTIRRGKLTPVHERHRQHPAVGVPVDHLDGKMRRPVEDETRGKPVVAVRFDAQWVGGPRHGHPRALRAELQWNLLGYVGRDAEHEASQLGLGGSNHRRRVPGVGNAPLPAAFDGAQHRAAGIAGQPAAERSGIDPQVMIRQQHPQVDVGVDQRAVRSRDA